MTATREAQAVDLLREHEQHLRYLARCEEIRTGVKLAGSLGLCDRTTAFLSARASGTPGCCRRAYAGGEPCAEHDTRDDDCEIEPALAAPSASDRGGASTAGERPTHVRCISPYGGGYFKQTVGKVYEVTEWDDDMPRVTDDVGHPSMGFVPGEWEPADAPTPPPPDLAAMREAYIDADAVIQAAAPDDDEIDALIAKRTAAARELRAALARAEPGREVAG